jgi:tetratricopeptide (TPR) repeat protein
VARLLTTAWTRAGVEPAAAASGRLWMAGGWRAELSLGGERREETAAFERGHHLLCRLAEFGARQAGGELGEPVLRSFDDLATPSPAALLHYLAGLGQDGEAARREWRRAFELDPHMAAPRTGLAALLLQAGEAEAAAGLLAGVSLSDGFAAAELGLGLWAAGEMALSFELLQAAVKANPQNALALAALAAQLARRAPGGEEAEQHEALDEAQLLATQATQLAGDDYRTWAALADVHRARGDFSQAGFFYGLALRLAPEAPALLKDAGANWLQARDVKQALPLIERAIAAAPQDAENLGNLAFARLLLGDAGAALEAARRAAKLGPNHARLRILHGDLALRAGRREEALEAWARAAELEPGITINPEGGNLGVEAE